MSTTAFFFVLLGVTSVSAQVFRFIGALEQPAPRRRRTATR